MKRKFDILWWLRDKDKLEDENPLFDKKKDNKIETVKEEKQDEKEIEKDTVIKTIIESELSPTPIKKDKVISTDDRQPNPLIEQRIDNIDTKEIKEEPKEEIKKDDYDNQTKLSTLDEMEIMIKKNYYELENIKYELQIIKIEKDNEVETKKIDELTQKLIELMKRLEELKKDFFNKNYKDLYKGYTSDEYINQLINEYKLAIKENDVNNASILQVKQIEEYINIINEIINVEIETDKEKEELDIKKEELDIRDTDFDKLKDDYKDVDKINDYVDKFVKEQDYIISDIEYKVKNSTNITKSVEYKTELVVNYSKILTSTLLLATTNIIPQTRRGNLLKLGLIVGAIGNLSSVVKPRSKENKTIIKVTYTDYGREIESKIDSLDNVTLTINKAITDINDLRQTFEKEFKEYANLIPEYKDMIIKLSTIEKDLIVKKDLIKDYNQRLDNTLNKNNVKIKSLTEDYPS